MVEWSADQWAAVITAVVGSVGAAIVAIIHAIKSSHGRQDVRERLCQLDQRMQQHEQNAQARTAQLMSAPPPAAEQPQREFPFP